MPRNVLVKVFDELAEKTTKKKKEQKERSAQAFEQRIMTMTITNRYNTENSNYITTINSIVSIEKEKKSVEQNDINDDDMTLKEQRYHKEQSSSRLQQGNNCQNFFPCTKLL